MRIVHILPVLLLAALVGGSAPTLSAQEHGAAQTAPGQAAPGQAAPGQAAPGQAAPAQPAEHAAPASHEPAGAVEHAAAKDGGHGGGAHHGPEVKLPFMHRALSPTEQYLLKAFNFVVFALLLILPLKGVLSAAFKARAQELEERLSLAEKDKAEGEAQVRELEARMAGLEGELAGILSKADADADAEKERVLTAARAEAEIILAQARTEIDFQRRLAEQELRALVAELAVEGAALRLRSRLEGPAAATMVDRAIDSISQRASEGGIH